MINDEFNSHIAHIIGVGQKYRLYGFNFCYLWAHVNPHLNKETEIQPTLTDCVHKSCLQCGSLQVKGSQLNAAH